MSRLWVIVLMLLVLLLFRFFFFYSQKADYEDGQIVKFQTTLFSEPQTIGRYQRVSANLENGNRIFIIIPRYPEFHYGQTLEISGPIKISKVDKISTQNRRVLINEKTVISIYYPKIKAVENDQNFIFPPIKILLAVTSSVRQNFIELFQKTLPPIPSSLLLGIVFGIKENMPKEFTDSLRLSGVFHVVAASGMNVTMTAGFLSSVFTLFFRRQYALVLTISGICFYAVLAGLEPSIIRASIMGVLVFSAQVLGRQRLSVYGLFTAGFVMLFVSPNLISDIGFQLSFLSTLGLLYLRPLFTVNKRMEKFIKKSLIGEEVVTTICAQAATMPILLANFGIYSLWSVIVNGLLLWTIPLLMVLGGIGAIAGLIIYPLGQLFLYLSLPFLLYFQKVVAFFPKLGGAVSVEYFPWQISLAYYFFLIAIVVLLGRKTDLRD